jgi:hypothetical protein
VTIESALQTVLDCMCTALAEQQVEEEHAWQGECCLDLAAPSFSSCCEDGGHAWVKLLRMFPSSQFPRDDVQQLNVGCAGAQQWALVVELGATRCACAAECGCDETELDAHLILGDMEAALKGVNCCFGDVDSCLTSEYRVNSATPAPPRNGCGGFRIQLTMAHMMNCCPDESA